MREVKKLSRECVVVSLWLIASTYFGYALLGMINWLAGIAFLIGCVATVKLVKKVRWLVMFKNDPVLTKARYLSYEAKKALGSGERVRRKIGGIFN